MKHIHTSIINRVLKTFGCLALTSLTSLAYADNVKMVWDANVESNLAGYNLYRGEESGGNNAARVNGSLITDAYFDDATAQSNQTYYYMVRAVDTDGLESGSSNEVAVDVVAARINAAPWVYAGGARTLTLPAAAGTFTAAATDDGMPNGVLQYSWSVVAGSGVTIASPNAASTGISFSAAGAYTLRATVSDGLLETSDDVVVTVEGVRDTTAPAITLTSPGNGGDVSGKTVVVTAMATDSVGVVGVQFKLDNVDLGPEDTTAPYSTVWNAGLTTIKGTHTLMAVARDAAGNQTTSSRVSVTVSAATPAPATITLTSPASGNRVTASVMVTAAASGGAGFAGVQFKLDNVDLGPEDTTAPYSTKWDTTQVSNGTHTLVAVGRDAAGNQTTSSRYSVTVSNPTGGGSTKPGGTRP